VQLVDERARQGFVGGCFEQNWTVIASSLLQVKQEVTTMDGCTFLNHYPIAYNKFFYESYYGTFLVGKLLERLAPNNYKSKPLATMLVLEQINSGIMARLKWPSTS